MFKKDFAWGTATAAYQIEGAYLEDGKGLSTWDVFSEQEGKTFHGANGRVACDSYHKYKEDVEFMKGLNAYRFSVAWSRVFPEGRGSVNQKGLDYYRRLIDELNQNGIDPSVTMFHWD